MLIVSSKKSVDKMIIILFVKTLNFKENSKLFDSLQLLSIDGAIIIVLAIASTLYEILECKILYKNCECIDFDICPC